MNHPSTPLTDAQANRLLARAVELDARLGAVSNVEDLRRAAVEAGVSPAAFDAAVQELQRPAPPPRPPFRNALLRNLLAAGTFWLVLASTTRAAAWYGASPTIHTLGMLFATSMGIQIAHHLRATALRTFLIAVGAGQAVVFLFHLAGIDTGRPNVLNWAVTFTGLLAAGIATYHRRSPTRRPPELAADSSDAAVARESQDESLFRLSVPAPQP